MAAALMKVELRSFTMVNGEQYVTMTSPTLPPTPFAGNWDTAVERLWWISSLVPEVGRSG